MAGLDSSFGMPHHEKYEAPVTRAELHQFKDSFLHSMERMFNKHISIVEERVCIDTVQPTCMTCLVLKIL
jgi:hypothetical protein